MLGIKFSQPCTRQTPSMLCYHSDPIHLLLKFFYFPSVLLNSSQGLALPLSHGTPQAMGRTLPLSDSGPSEAYSFSADPLHLILWPQYSVPLPCHPVCHCLSPDSGPVTLIPTQKPLRWKSVCQSVALQVWHSLSRNSLLTLTDWNPPIGLRDQS